MLGRVLGKRARVRHHRGDPFAGIARDIDGKRPPRHVRRVESGHEWQAPRCELAAVEDIVRSGHRQRGSLVDRNNAGGRMRRRDQRHVLHLGQGNVGGKAALTGDEAPVLAHAPVGRHELKALRLSHGATSAGRFTPRKRSAASAIASTICT